MDEGAWEQRGKTARAGLEPLQFLVGEWRGAGTCHGRSITAHLVVQPILDGTWIEARESQFDASGALEHADVSLYRFDPDEDHIRVLHLNSHAHMEQHPVTVDDDGVRWFMGLDGPRLLIHPLDGGIRVQVWTTDDDADLDLRYEPA